MSLIKRNIANIITLSNLFCGLLSILYAFGGHLNIAAGLIIIGICFDFIDGLIARLLKISGEFGKQLDSMADLITFGVAPAIIIYQLLFLLDNNTFFNPFEEWETRDVYTTSYLPYVSLLIPLFSAFRLAKFNIDTKQNNNFIGLPTPANALFLISFPLIIQFHPDHPLLEYITNAKVLSAIIILLCLFMVSRIPLLTLKFTTYTWIDNKIRYLLILSSILLLWQFHFVAIPFIVILYLILSTLNNLIK